MNQFIRTLVSVCLFFLSKTFIYAGYCAQQVDPIIAYEIAESVWTSTANFDKPSDIAVNFIRLINPTTYNSKLNQDGMENVQFLRAFYGTNLELHRQQIQNNTPNHIAIAAVTLIEEMEDGRFSLKTFTLGGMFASGTLGRQKISMREIPAQRILNMDFNVLVYFNGRTPQRDAHSERAIMEYIYEFFPIQNLEETKAIIIHIQNILPTCLNCYHEITTTNFAFNKYKTPIYVCVGHLDKNNKCKMDVYSRLHTEIPTGDRPSSPITIEEED